MSKEQNKNYGKSIRAKLLNVAKKENIFYQTILTRYFQERLLYRMSQTRYRSNFKDYHGIRLSIPVMMDSIAQVLTMDIGFGDVVTPSPVNLDFPILLEHLPCANILAYSLETVIAEKMHAIIDLADQSSRMKDYYDLHRILKEEEYDTEVLQEAIIRTFENRHTPYDANTMFFRNDFGINQQMEVRWKAFMRKITKTNDIAFSEVVAFIQETLRPYWENIPHE